MKALLRLDVLRQINCNPAGDAARERTCSFTSSMAAGVGTLLAIAALLVAFGGFAAVGARADTPVTLYRSFAGNINITGTGGTLRTAADGNNSCSVSNSGSMQLLGVPAGSTIVAAYLYWGGSGGDPAGGADVDYNVTFNGTPVFADRSYTATYNNSGNYLYFFGGVKDVTSLVTGNGTYTFSDLTVQNANVTGGGSYCSSAAVLSGFSLVVVYSNPSETLHVVNLWEGLQTYRGGSISLTPSNFKIPSSGINGRHLVLTWEGDDGNSGSLNGYNENLTFCSPAPCAGIALTDSYNPTNNQFNSTIDIPPNGPFSGINTTWGVDMDMYDISGMLHAGDGSAQAVYSSGADLVLLANQTMSVSNVPVAELQLTKSHSGNFAIGGTGSFQLTVKNNGPSNATGTMTVTDTLPTGLTYVSGTGTGWTCSAAGQVVTCTRTALVNSGASAPPITLAVSVGTNAASSVTNTASVASTDFDNIMANNTASDTVTVIAPNLSTSTKNWLDLNGGDQNPGDVLQYTITLNETAGIAANNVSVTDTIPANVTDFTVISVPTGAANNSTTAGGTNGTGYLNVGNISVPANGSVTIVFNVTINAGAAVGATIDNTATVTNPYGPGGTPAAPTVTVSESSIPGTGNKPLYLYNGTSSPAYKLSRTPMSVTPASYVAVARNTTQSWNLSPVLQSAVTISSGTIPVSLWLSTDSTRTYSIPVTLRCGATSVATVTQSTALTNGAAAARFIFNLPLAADYTCPAGSLWRLDVTNTESAGTGRNIRVYPAPATGSYSNVTLPSKNVINVDSVAFYDAAYPAGSTMTSTAPGSTVRIRATISDPFGSYDISGATVAITDPAGTLQQSAIAMTQVYDSGVAVKIYEYAYTVPAGGLAGNWTARVVASEGTEGTVTDLGLATLQVYMPNFTIMKSSQTISDPVNGAVNPKAIPGAQVLYRIMVTNSGRGPATNNSIVITDPIPANTALIVSGTPVGFTDGTAPAASGLSFSWLGLANTTDDVQFSNNGGTSYTYTPMPDANGADSSVTHLRITPKGIFAASDGTNNPTCTFSFKVLIQ